MATSLSTTPLSNSILPKRITKQSLILNPSSLSSNNSLNLSHALEYRNHVLKLSPSKYHVTIASAVSSSSGVRSSEETGSSLDTVKVFDLKGNGIPLSDLWKDRKAVVAFARHFGCVFCRKRADYLASKKAKAFAEQTKFQGEIYADPAHASYEALEFVSGALTTFTPTSGLKLIQLYMEGYRQDWKLSFEKDTVTRGGWKQGGIIVAGPGKSNISYIHKDKEAGDDPDIEDILKACCL
ncbi:thioredoxin-like protein AAED1, chloroplastic isoform X2 [Prosopis cineraria]|uniref:thioredoxin-like protein AAED1, chloroplastic isoform X2 n=1 Tax=Prosopis cineraria TaxID=364024 RepID=UPI00240EEE33|nr:thioredoxin-like protein AAED1, chloroplastic isoform X2 [Prosopis cineraria]